MALHRSQETLGVTRRAPIIETAAVAGAPLYLYSSRKRALDISIALAGVLAVAILLPFVALAIKLGSPGPVFYTQRRMGLNGKTFNLIKFRTMAIDAEADGNAVWSSRNDPRITGVGKVLRRLYVDEFPQWWNVLKGDMSVVGPRPERPELAARIVSVVPDFNRRLLAKPGLTGVAQVSYKYTSTMAEARNKLRLDMVYINAASFWLDAKLILRTVRRLSAFKGT
jgi:lipopolysaccharide/colanic/teichoic acid biosynthesis glycosyltransferase